MTNWTPVGVLSSWLASKTRAYDVSLASNPRRARAFARLICCQPTPLWCSGHCVLLQRNTNSQKTGETNSSLAPRWEHGGRVCVLAVIRIMEVTPGNLKRVCVHVCGTVPRRADASWHKTNSNKEKKEEYSSTAQVHLNPTTSQSFKGPSKAPDVTMRIRMLLYSIGWMKEC